MSSDPVQADENPFAGRAPAGRRLPLLAWMAIAVALLVLAGALWRARSQKPRYVTATVTRGNIQRSVSATGALNPVVTVQVGSYVSGTIKKLGCDYNTEVVVGQVCATIDPVPFQLVVDEDRAQVGTTVAQLKKDQAALVYAKTAYERDSKLLADGTVSQDTVDSEKSAYDQAMAQIGLDQAAIVDKSAALKAAEVNLAYTNIVSPVVGTVITRSIDVGQTVAASLQSPTLFIIGKDLTHMQVDTNVSEADVGEVRIGQDGFFTVQAFPGRTFRGKVTQIRHGPITVQNVVTYDVVVAVRQSGPRALSRHDGGHPHRHRRARRCSARPAARRAIHPGRSRATGRRIVPGRGRPAGALPGTGVETGTGDERPRGAEVPRAVKRRRFRRGDGANGDRRTGPGRSANGPEGASRDEGPDGTTARGTAARCGCCSKTASSGRTGDDGPRRRRPGRSVRPGVESRRPGCRQRGRRREAAPDRRRRPGPGQGGPGQAFRPPGPRS